MNTVCDFSILFFLSHILPSPKDTHKKVFGSHLGVMIYPLYSPNTVFPKLLHMQLSICL
jgi:hypothetical protein